MSFLEKFGFGGDKAKEEETTETPIKTEEAVTETTEETPAEEISSADEKKAE